MKVKTEFQSNWIFDPKWLEAFKNEICRRLPNRKVWLIVEDKPFEDYIIMTDGRTGKVIVHFNMYDKEAIEAIFKGKYLDALVEHEIKHLEPNLDFQHDSIPASESILLTKGVDAHREATKMLTDKFQDLLRDIYANSAMSTDGLKRYLEFEINKLKMVWPRVQGTMRTVWMLIGSYIEACYEAIGESIPSELTFISNSLQEDESNIAIYRQMKVAYSAMWKAVKSGQRNVDLKRETYKLNELVQRQRNPWL